MDLLIRIFFLQSELFKGNGFQNKQKSQSFTDGLNSNQEQVVFRKSNLEALTVGKNRIEIEELMGPPDGRSLDGGNGYLWDYRRAVYDESTDKVFTWSLISFKFLKGRCSYVTIRLEDIPVYLLEDANKTQ